MSNLIPDESTNVKWMYEGANSSIDREQYLLGKRITKAPEDKGDFIVENTGNENLSVNILERLDYESKVREDPLFSIRKKEDEKRRELLSNPVKRKRLQSALKNAIIKDLESSQHKKKSKKKKQRSDSSSSDDSSEDERSKKLISNANKDKSLHAALKKALEKDLGTSRNSSSSDSESKRKKHRKDRKRHKESRDHKRSKKKKHKSNDSLSEREQEPEEEKKKVRNHREGYGLILVKPHTEKKTKVKRRSVTPPPVKEKYARKEKSGFSRKLSKKELEKKRKEMMSNADWRDEQRKKNVMSYKKEEEEEKSRDEKIQRIHDEKMKRDGKVKTFLHEMRLKQTSTGTLEDTVRRKRHRLDRSSND